MKEDAKVLTLPPRDPKRVVEAIKHVHHRLQEDAAVFDGQKDLESLVRSLLRFLESLLVTDGEGRLLDEATQDLLLALTMLAVAAPTSDLAKVENELLRRKAYLNGLSAEMVHIAEELRILKGQVEPLEAMLKLKTDHETTANQQRLRELQARQRQLKAREEELVELRTQESLKHVKLDLWKRKLSEALPDFIGEPLPANSVLQARPEEVQPKIEAEPKVEARPEPVAAIAPPIGTRMERLACIATEMQLRPEDVLLICLYETVPPDTGHVGLVRIANAAGSLLRSLGWDKHRFKGLFDRVDDWRTRRDVYLNPKPGKFCSCFRRKKGPLPFEANGLLSPEETQRFLKAFLAKEET
ncbi:hypothetical protein A2856_00450 [Candidatus Uhrbacteria bacterium RIFCSPHIGHO2_01_FULL_63_20]|uniref:Uncharacterized protein n=1 Tax=Candidatus Uhrbacteria bacterium RIFCSPHIGHO2_01_FULL_63_20 TaxID=1802385 RepID=A0A1F7TLV1_9BACT|nr:MAG: hypothetical protein A2856_00450 [Candidatus Uhrbacteria bacterium RIFCSPHIGHO2_01_FULL_63_20]